MMKLSEKGFKALLHKVRSGFFWGYEDDIHKAKDHDFKPDDFKGVVCLTVDEASEVWDSLVNLVSYVESIDGGMSDLVRDGQRSIDLIRNRVKKAEKNNANN